MGFPKIGIAFFQHGELLLFSEKKEQNLLFQREELPQLFVESIQMLKKKINLKNKLSEILTFIVPCWPGPLTALGNALNFVMGLLQGSPSTPILKPSFFTLYKENPFLGVFLGGSKWMIHGESKEMYRKNYGEENIIEPTDLDRSLFLPTQWQFLLSPTKSISSCVFFGKKKPEYPWISLDQSLSQDMFLDLLNRCALYGENHKLEKSNNNSHI